MIGRVLQVNISPGGVPKMPITGAMITPLGLEGDSHAHPQHHGGPRKAVLLVANEIIMDLVSSGWPVFAGALGENITTEGLDYKQLRVGQRFRLGQAIIELTKLRQPCATLDVYGSGIQHELFDKDVKAGNVHSPVWGRGGFYASVVQTGEVRPHDIIALIDQAV